MRRLLIAFALPALAACPETPDPTAADVAAYLGLSAGTTKTYQAGALTETHEVTTSSLASVDSGLVFDVIAKQNGFVTDATQDRTFAIETAVATSATGRGVDQFARIDRFFDCIVRCGTLSAPIALFPIPLDDGNQQVTTVDVSVTENNGAPTVTSETHTVLVGAESEVTVPAGTFTGFSVSWARSRGDQNDTAILVVVPDVGIVRWDGFDGTRLELLP